MNPAAQAIPFLTLFKRAALEQCPNCGKAKLFYKYLKQVDHCPVCNEKWSVIRADDAPAWFTILVVGHIVVPLALSFEADPPWPSWASMPIWGGLALTLTLLFLPRAKALFIGLIWKYCPPRLKTSP